MFLVDVAEMSVCDIMDWKMKKKKTNKNHKYHTVHVESSHTG